MFTEKYRVLRATTAGEQRVDPVALPIHFFKNMSRAIGDGLNRGQVVQCEIISRGGERKSGRRAFEGRIGSRRAIAVKVGLDVEVARECSGKFYPVGFSKDVESLVEQFVDCAALFLGGALQRLGRRVRIDHMIDQRAGGGLTSFGEPHPGHHRGEIWPPDPINKKRLGGNRHVARRGAADQREATLQGSRSRLLVGYWGAKHTQAAGMRINDRNSDRYPWSQSELLGRFFSESTANRFTHRANRLADALEFFRRKIAEADLLKVVLIPTFAGGALVSEVCPFADGRAK